MMQILQLQGTETELYRLVAPLVMNPKVIKQNLNFPFRTAEHFVWFVAVAEDEEEVLGFLPVECKRLEQVINNYYVQGKNAELLEQLVQAAVDALGEEGDMAAVSFLADEQIFARQGFVEEKRWTNYVRMKRQRPATVSDSDSEEQKEEV